MSTFVICCGGTGGHLSPGISLAEGLIEKGHQCTLVISNKEVDSRLLIKYSDLRFVRAPGAPFSLRPLRFLRFAIAQTRGLAFALSFLRSTRPDALIGFGGFLTAGMTLAAFLLGIPVVLHEANRKVGRAIRMLSGFARRIYLPPGVRLKGVPPQTVRYCGFPVRREIRRINREAARSRLGVDIPGRLLVVLGGSQGASALNDWVTANFEALGRDGISVYCVTGLGKGGQGVIQCESLDGRPVKAYFSPFCDQMAELLSSADLVVSRAGAGSIAEFVRCRVPAVLVPYPFAADNHQWENALCFERQGCGIVVDAKKLDSLRSEVSDLVFNDWLLEKFRRNLERLDRQNSLDVIIRDLEKLCAENRPAPTELQATV